jgi:hypothetical protein
MSKKTLLSESQIRQFMKLAKLEPMTPGFVEGLTEKKHADEDLEEGRGMRMRGEDDDLEEGRGMRRDEDEEMEEGMHGMRRDEDEVDEVRTGLGPDYDLTRPKRGHGGGTGPEDGIREEEHAELEVDAAEMEDAAGDEELEMDAELDAPAAEAGKMVSVDDFLSALERALEDAMGEEVEIDADEAEADEPPDAMDAMTDEPVDDMTEAAHDDEEKLEEAEEVVEEEKVDEALMETITKRVAKRILMEALSTKK